MRKLILTASGGPFRGRTRAELELVTIEDALKHPTWDMGAKITIDSSTLMNKGLEVIEAHELFGVDYDQVEVVVHPQSVIHGMVEFSDGATIAQLSMPDMRLPIGLALGAPARLDEAFGEIDWTQLSSLTFEQPDLEAFPCLALAYEAGRSRRGRSRDAERGERGGRRSISGRPAALAGHRRGQRHRSGPRDRERPGRRGRSRSRPGCAGEGPRSCATLDPGGMKG